EPSIERAELVAATPALARALDVDVKPDADEGELELRLGARQRVGVNAGRAHALRCAGLERRNVVPDVQPGGFARTWRAVALATQSSVQVCGDGCATKASAVAVSRRSAPQYSRAAFASCTSASAV